MERKLQFEPRFSEDQLEGKIAEARGALSHLENMGAIVTVQKEELDAFKYDLSFKEEDGAIVTVGVTLHDHQIRDADLVIDSMTTLPHELKGKGYGTRVITKIKDWARGEGWSVVCATQVNNENSRRFWKKNGFVPREGPNTLGDFLFDL